MATRTIPFTIDTTDGTGLVTTGVPTATVQYAAGAPGVATVTQRTSGWSVGVDDTQDALVIVTAAGATTFGFTVTKIPTVALTAAYDAAKTANALAPDNASAQAAAASAASADGKLTAGRLAKVDGAAQETVATANRAAVITAVDGNVTGDVVIGPLTRLDASGNIVSAPLGEPLGIATAGSDITAFLASDTARSQPKRHTVAEPDGGYQLAIAPGATYTVAWSRDGFEDPVTGASVVLRTIII